MNNNFNNNYDNENYININNKIISIESNPKQIGGFGSIHLAKSKTNAEIYAVKILKKSIYENNRLWIQNEICILEHINKKHKNIVNFFGYKETLTKYYIVFEYIPGKELYEFVAFDHSLFDNVHIIENIFQEIIEGLHFLHHNGIAHRDLKLENILIYPEEGIVKIIDFGLSISTQCNDENDNILTRFDFVGTPYTMAPEVLCYHPKFHEIQQSSAYFSDEDEDEKMKKRKYKNECVGYNPFLADMWSTGIILYMMMYKIHPFVNISKNIQINDQIEIYYHSIQRKKLTFPSISSHNYKDEQEFNLIKKIRNWIRLLLQKNDPLERLVTSDILF